MAEHKGFEVPNHTQTPNSFFDKALPQIKSLAELKVILAIIRYTFGWRKMSDKISLTQLQQATGMTRQGVANGLKLALEHGLIERKQAGNSFSYSLSLLVNEIDQSTPLTSQPSRPKTVNEIDQKVVNQIDTQKKGIKEKKEIPAYAVLFDKHFRRIGKVPDPKAQGDAIKWILANHSAEKAVACYDAQLKEPWRKGHVSWLSVKSRIGEFQYGGNGRSYVDDVLAGAVSMEELKRRANA